MENLGEKVLVSVLSAAIISAAAATIGIYAEIKGMRTELVQLTVQQTHLTLAVEDHEKRLIRLEVAGRRND